MRTILNIDDDLLSEAECVTGVSEKTALVRAGLKALIEKESARRLAKLGGTKKKLALLPTPPNHRAVILVDSSVWVDHLRHTELEPVRLLDDGEVMIHPFIFGELACDNF